MLTLRAPSFHVGAGRAFTRCVPTSDASCRHPAPARRFLLRPPASASCAALEHTRSVSPRDQNRSTVPSLRGAISSVARRWRNDSRRLPSCRILCLPPQIHTAFQPRTPDASRRRTESLVMPSLLRSSVTLAHRFARVLALAQRLCGENYAPCDTQLHRPSLPIRFGDERLPSVSAD